MPYWTTTKQQQQQQQQQNNNKTTTKQQQQQQQTTITATATIILTCPGCILWLKKSMEGYINQNSLYFSPAIADFIGNLHLSWVFIDLLNSVNMVSYVYFVFSLNYQYFLKNNQFLASRNLRPATDRHATYILYFQLEYLL